MRYETLLALRYMRSRRSFGFVTLISVISVAGITTGVAALIIVLSVFNGFGSLVTSILVSFDPHVRIESVGRRPVEAYDTLLTLVGQREDVKGVSPFVAGKALVLAGNSMRVVTIKGVDVNTVSAVSGLQDKIVIGDMKLDDGRGGGILLGLNLADRLGVVVGDTLAIVSPSSVAPAVAQFGMPLIRWFHVKGMYESNNKDYDSFYAFVELKDAQSLFQTGGAIDGYEVRLASINRSEHLQGWVEDEFADRFRALTWHDLHRELYTVMQVERWAAYIIVSLIVAVASFNLLGSLTMTVIEKTRDIGILKAMGATDDSIARVFRSQGFFVGILGTTLGISIGLTVVWLQDVYHLFPLDPTVYIIAALPVEIRWYDIVVVAGAAIGLSVLASRSPARRAAGLVPVEAIRWE